MKRLKLIFFALLFCSVVSALPDQLHIIKSHTNFTDRVKQFFGFPTKKRINIQVLNSLTTLPLAQTYVSVSENQEDPKNHLFTYTDENGYASFEVISENLLDITAAKQGFGAYSLFAIGEADLTFFLEPLDVKVQTVQLSGQFTGWPKIVNGDDKVDLGLIIPFIKLSQLLDFNFGSLLGPPTKGKAYGDRDIPGNLVLPKQKEYYYKIVPVEFEHPVYTLNLEKNATHNLLAIMGHVPFSILISTFISGGSIEKALNTLEFTKIQLLNNFFIDQNQVKNIALGKNLKPNVLLSIDNIPPNRSVVTVSAGNIDGQAKEFFPLSFKVIPKTKQVKQVQLATMDEMGQAQNYIVAVATDMPENANEDRKFESSVSGIIQHDSNENRSWEGNLTLNTFFSLIELTRDQQKNSFSYTDAYNPAVSPSPVMSVSSINYTVESQENMTPSKKSRIWTLVMPATQKSFQLPEVPFINDLIPDPSKTAEKDELTWEVGVYAFEESEKPLYYENIDDIAFRKHVSHFSRNKIVLQK